MLLWILCFWLWNYTSSTLLSHFHCIRNTPWASYCSFFLCNVCSFFSCVGGVLVTNLFFHCPWLLYFGYLANYNKRVAFVIIFLMCSDLLKCLKRVHTIFITTESGYNSLKVIFTKHFLTKATIFCCFDVFSVRPPQTFQVQAKISTIRPAFPDYLSVSDYYDIMYCDWH